MRYRLKKHADLDANALEIVRNLNRFGVCVSTIDKINGLSDPFQELDIRTQDLVAKKHDEIVNAGSKIDSCAAIGAKSFNMELLGESPAFDPGCKFVHFSLQDTILGIVNSYFGMMAKLRYFNIWKTFSADSEARESQLWHRDREDRKILKVFVYLSDVGEGNGPFTYAPGTHSGGVLYGARPEYSMEQNVQRSTDEQMASVSPEDSWIRATGGKGTIVFADTAGYHKGGEARTGDRLMFTCMFTSQASDSKRLIEYPVVFDSGSLGRRQVLALEKRSN